MCGLLFSNKIDTDALKMENKIRLSAFYSQLHLWNLFKLKIQFTAKL